MKSHKKFIKAWIISSKKSQTNDRFYIGILEQLKKTMKGIILHGEHGTRLRSLTHTGPKQLLPIVNKSMSQYALEDLKHQE